ncbi:hypothetical protein DM46_2966 [Burkholderia mallei]|nr:hypothetical protein DM46_2966 [Burkholderia mallei]
MTKCRSQSQLIAVNRDARRNASNASIEPPGVPAKRPAPAFSAGRALPAGPNPAAGQPPMPGLRHAAAWRAASRATISTPPSRLAG